MSIRKTLRNYGLKNVSIYSYNEYLHIFFSSTNVSTDRAVAEYIGIPIYINGTKYNALPGLKKPP